MAKVPGMIRLPHLYQQCFAGMFIAKPPIMIWILDCSPEQQPYGYSHTYVVGVQIQKAKATEEKSRGISVISASKPSQEESRAEQRPPPAVRCKLHPRKPALPTHARYKFRWRGDGTSAKSPRNRPPLPSPPSVTMATTSHLLLLLVLCVAAGAAVDALRLPPDASFPGAQAERLIRALNLLPKDSSSGRGGARVGAGAEEVAPGQLLERRVTLPGLPEGVADLGHHAGYYRLPNTHDARMFYFFFESRGKKEDPVVIWLTGGPGCSSELAVFYENGPFTIANNMSLVWNKFGWDKISNIIFVDQPTGTGFSYSSDDRDTRHDETGVSNDLYEFLQVFFKKHPEFVKNDFFITGESYAGHYIPAFASRVHQGNKKNEGTHINLKGFAIGNGLTDPAIQYKAYTDYALDMNLIQKADYERINKFIPPCEFAIKLCGTNGKASCMAAYMVCNTIFNSIMKLVGTKNYYDVRKECEGKLCYDFSNLEKFFGDKAVRQAIGVGDIEFVSCSTSVYQAMLTDWMRNLEVGIPALLEDGINVLIYAGEYDLICNWLGNSRWVHSMEWSGQKDFAKTAESSFLVDDAQAGVLKSHGALSFLKVHNAGHMVPMDQPKAALEMLRRFTQGKLKEAISEEESSTTSFYAAM